MISFTIGKTGRVGLSRKNQLRFRAMCHFLGMLACLSSLSIGAQLRTVRVGIIMDGPWERNEEILEATQREILELTHREFDVRFPPEKIVQADWKAEGVRAAIDRFLADPEVDLIITWGLIGSDIICRLEGLPKPVIAPVVVNVDLQGIPFDPETGTSGVSNLSYVSWPLQRVRADLEKFHEITSFRKLTYLVNAAYPDANPSLPRSIIKAAQRLDFEVELTFVEVGFSAEDALARIPQDTEAVYVAPLLQLSPEEFELLVKDLIERRLPSFSLLGTSDVEQGLMASLSLDTDFDRLSRRIALNLQRILLGEDAGTLPVTFERGERLTINMETARAIGVYPSWSLITEADLLNPEREDIGRHLTLSRVVRDALSTNLDLRAMEHLVAAGIEEIQKARSVLLPRIDLSSLGMFIDGDRAEGSFGSQGRRNLSGSATLTQLVYSEPARANLDIQRHRQTTREERRQQLRLDIALATASAYLNVLRGKTSERIQRENLHRTRRHLAIAQDRLRVGMASRSEVLRWESEIASVRRAVIRANARRNQSEIEVNRLLHRPLEEKFETEPEGISQDSDLKTTFFRIRKYVGNPWSFSTFRDFMAKEGLAASPDLRKLDAAIAVQQRILVSARRAFWAPVLALTGEGTARARGGAGSDFALADLFPGLDGFPKAGNFDWTLAFNVQFPLFTSGEKEAEVNRAREELARLRFERDAVAEGIEQRIRSALHGTGSSYASIELADAAMKAAQQNLELVTDAYQEGVLSIIDLIDAKNTSLVAEQVAANAFYDYLVDLMEVQHAVGRFDFLASPGEQQEWRDRLDFFFNQASASGEKEVP